MRLPYLLEIFVRFVAILLYPEQLPTRAKEFYRRCM